MRKTSFFFRNGLSIVLLILMFVFWTGQFITGWKDHNEELSDHGQSKLTAVQYITSGHFISATFENWESEFLQMALYVLLTVGLRQKGSSESKKLTGKEEVDREPKRGPKAPWPVRKGGIWLIDFTILFMISFCLHFV